MPGKIEVASCIEPLDEATVDHVHGDVPGVEDEGALACPGLAKLLAEVAVLDAAEDPVHQPDDTDLLHGITLRDHLAGHLRAPQDVMADEDGVRGARQRIVHLEVAQSLHAALDEARQDARP